jgi:hypothetical protein
MRCFFVPVLALVLGSTALEQQNAAESGLISDFIKHGNLLIAKNRKLQTHIAHQAGVADAHSTAGHLLVNGPLPADFADRFSQAVAKATGADAKKVKLTGSQDVEEAPGVVEIGFEAPPKVVNMVENEASDPNSKLSAGTLHFFLVAKEDKETDAAAPAPAKKGAKATAPKLVGTPVTTARETTPVEEKGIDIDTAMPYGDLEPFGREDTAQELTESSVTESDQMVDQLERAEVAEEKRAVFRALTRLRGAAITSFDGVARSQTGNIDEYNKVHKWRKTHPLHHLADEESDITKWAFPDNADF